MTNSVIISLSTSYLPSKFIFHDVHSFIIYLIPILEEKNVGYRWSNLSKGLDKGSLLDQLQEIWIECLITLATCGD